jgi:hypothetical protein
VYILELLTSVIIESGFKSRAGYNGARKVFTIH